VDVRRDRVDDPIGADVPRRVVLDGDSGRDARPEHEQRRLRPALGHMLVLTDQPRHG
jgi:hypothetical protein